MGTKERQDESRRDKRRGKTPRRTQADHLDWFNPEPDKDDKAWLDDNAGHFHEVLEDLSTGMTDADRITVRFDESAGRWLAVLVLGAPEERSSKVGVSVRAADVLGALAFLAYAHVHKYRGHYPDKTVSQDDRWG